MKQRVWIQKHELEGVQRVFLEYLGSRNDCLVPFEKVLPLLEKQEITRILWCRQAKTEIERWGLKIGIRRNRNAYKVQVIDRQKWIQSISGLVQDGLNADDPYKLEEPEQPESEELQHLIPEPDPEYVFPEWAGHLKTAIEDGEKCLLVGPTGSGKSSLVRELAARQRIPFIRINLNGETSVSDIIGSWRIQQKEMIFQHGPVALAVRHGAWLCLDELDAALPAVLFALQGILEDGGSLHLQETNEYIKPHRNFRLIATANTIGRGDDSGLYQGTNLLNEAMLDRFHSVFNVDYLPPESEIQLVLRKFPEIEEAEMDKLLGVSRDLRRAISDGTLYATFSTRKLLAWASKTIQLGDIGLAASYTILNKLPQDDRRVVSEILQRHGVLGGSR